MSSAARRLPSVRERLREATDEIHQALHRAAPFARIADGTMDRGGYGRVLLMLHRYHTSMAAHCAAGADALDAPQLAFAHRSRIQALEDDLAYLALAGAQARAGAPKSKLRRVRLAAERTERHSAEGREAGPEAAFSIGCLYTVQGSTLGGKVIHRQLDRLVPGEDGRRFFKGTAEDGALWQSLCAGLENCTGDAHLADMEEGAHYAFRQFAHFLKD
jgi:heme oxygenase